ncbi:MAG: ABC transporter permease subunit [Candidatus Hydrogenedentota bacterium]
MLNLLRHELFSRWGAVLGWGSGLSLFGVLYIAIYPQIADKIGVLADISFYQTMGVDMGSFEGIIASSVILNFVVMLGVFVIISSSDTLSGEEDRGTLELVVTMPLRRWHIVTTKSIALAVVILEILVLAGICSVIALIWMKNSIAVDVTSAQLFIAVLSCFPITMAILMIGLFFSASMPNRRIASMATTVVFVASYLGEMLARSVDSLEVIRPIFLFHYFDSSANLFLRGVQFNDVAILAGIALVFFVLTLISFQRRDITVAQWPWQRAVARHARGQVITDDESDKSNHSDAH